MRTLFNHQNFDRKGRRMTFAGLVDEKENTISIGVSTCSLKDQFCKKTGRVKAEGQARSQNPVVVIQMMGESSVKDFHIAVQELSNKEAVLTV